MCKISITHVTSVHPRYDTRIFLKECSSLAKIQNYKVSLIVADNQGDEIKNNVEIYDVGKLQGRINRILKTTQKVYNKAVELDSDIYHLHDPELIGIGLKLKKLGKKVIFDAHEDVPKQLLSKPYLNRFLLGLLSKTFAIYEKITCSKFDYIVTATPTIQEKFLVFNKNVIDIKNFPIVSELGNDIQWNDKKNEVCYIGAITATRGIREIIESLAYLDGVKLNLAGNFVEKDVEDEVKKSAQWQSVHEYGFVNREKIAQILGKSKVGLVTLHPLISYQEALPIKMFEYMLAGIPVVSSNFPLWSDIVEKSNCGICVNPLSPKEIADAISYLISHPIEAQQMGKNGKEAVLQMYNWDNEAKRLLKMYEELYS
jgi:glycosyltransferase involved in cell wall biosynthesis